PAEVVAAIDRAALVLDVGSTLDIVARHEHVADILLTTELAGFTHEELALTSAIVLRAGDRHAHVMSMGVPDRVGGALVERAAIILALADEIEARCPRDRRIITVQCDIGRHVVLTIPALPSWLAEDLDARFERAFGRRLIVRHR